MNGDTQAQALEALNQLVQERDELKAEVEHLKACRLVGDCESLDELRKARDNALTKIHALECELAETKAELKACRQELVNTNAELGAMQGRVDAVRRFLGGES